MERCVPSHYPNVALTLSFSHGARGLLLQQLQVKLRAIQRKGGLNVKTEDAGCPKTVGDGCPQAKPAGTVASEDVYMVVPIGKGGEA